MSKYIIYALVDPETNEIRYIGKSSRGLQRPKAHLRPNLYNQNRYVYNWIRPLMERGLTPRIEVLEELPGPEGLYGREQWHIKHHREIGTRLTNLSDGGPGWTGPKPEEVKRKISAALKGRPAPVRSAEHLEKIRLSHLGKVRSEETRLRMAKGKGGRPFMDQNGVVYDSIQGAARQLGLTATAICAILKQRPGHKSTKGYTFKYVDPDASRP